MATVSLDTASEEYYEHLVKVHGMDPMMARQIVEIEAGRSDGDVKEVSLDDREVKPRERLQRD